LGLFLSPALCPGLPFPPRSRTFPNGASDVCVFPVYFIFFFFNPSLSRGRTSGISRPPCDGAKRFFLFSCLYLPVSHETKAHIPGWHLGSFHWCVAPFLSVIFPFCSTLVLQGPSSAFFSQFALFFYGSPLLPLCLLAFANETANLGTQPFFPLHRPGFPSFPHWVLFSTCFQARWLSF